jgi:hypothetical protein
VAPVVADPDPGVLKTSLGICVVCIVFSIKTLVHEDGASRVPMSYTPGITTFSANGHLEGTDLA